MKGLIQIPSTDVMTAVALKLRGLPVGTTAHLLSAAATCQLSGEEQVH